MHLIFLIIFSYVLLCDFTSVIASNKIKLILTIWRVSNVPSIISFTDNNIWEFLKNKRNYIHESYYYEGKSIFKAVNFLFKSIQLQKFLENGLEVSLYTFKKKISCVKLITI